MAYIWHTKLGGHCISLNGNIFSVLLVPVIASLNQIGKRRHFRRSSIKSPGWTGRSFLLSNEVHKKLPIHTHTTNSTERSKKQFNMAFFCLRSRQFLSLDDRDKSTQTFLYCLVFWCLDGGDWVPREQSPVIHYHSPSIRTPAGKPTTTQWSRWSCKPDSDKC